MSDFEYDNRCKKNIANSASKRVRNKRGCKLPQDTMTKKQLENKNGPVRTYQLRAPMSMQDFRTMPPHIQCEYISFLRAEFQISDNSIGKMMGCSGANIYHFRKQNGIDLKSQNYPTTEQRKRWEQFCAGTLKYDSKPVAEPEPKPVVEEKKPVIQKEAPAPVKEPAAKPEKASAIKRYSADLTVRTWEELYAVLQSFPTPNKDFSVHIEVDIAGSEK